MSLSNNLIKKLLSIVLNLHNTIIIQAHICVGLVSTVVVLGA